MPTYFIGSPQIQGDYIHIVGPLFKHLKDALRIKPGESLIFVDEERRRYITKADRISPQLLVARIIECLEPTPLPALSITLGQGIIKGKKMDWFVQKATEIGVSQIVPLLTRRTVVHLEGSKVKHQQERWQVIAHEAAQQSGRDHVPQIQPICSFNDFIQSTDTQLRLILWEGETEQSLKNELSIQKHFTSGTILIGPEGGFTREEAEQAKNQSFRAVHLGNKILRAETAGLVTLAIFQYLWGDIGG